MPHNDDNTKTISARMFEIESDTAHLSEEKIKEALETHSNVIDQWAYALHDKDLKPDGTLKNPHYHVETHYRYPCELTDVAAWFGLETNFIKRIKSPRFSSAIAYLTHANAPEKHQYDVSEVKANFDVRSTINNELVVKGKKKRRLEIIQGIFDGEITEYNYTDGRLTDMELFEYKRDIQNAFEVVWCMNADIAKLYDCVGTGIPNPVPAYLETLGESTKAHELDDIQDFFRDVNGSDSPNIDTDTRKFNSEPEFEFEVFDGPNPFDSDSEPKPKCDSFPVVDSEPEFVSEIEITDDWIAGIDGEFI